MGPWWAERGQRQRGSQRRGLSLRMGVPALSGGWPAASWTPGICWALRRRSCTLSQAPAVVPQVLLGTRVMRESRACPQRPPNLAQETSQWTRTSWGSGGHVRTRGRVDVSNTSYFTLPAHNSSTYCVPGTVWTIPPNPRSIWYWV